jgi:hypothetical protein
MRISLFIFLWPFMSICNTGNSEDSSHFLIFINGHRGAKANREITNNRLHLKDLTGYWYDYDDTIIQRFQPVQAVYFDGHHPVTYSMHRNNARFVKAYLFSRFCWISKRSRWVLNKKFNPEGFEARVQNGRMAGEKWWLWFKENHPEIKTPTVHFVSHSMGYAYSLGMIEVLSRYVKFGKMLAIAPESGGFKGFDLQLFDEVWQYGSNMDQPNADVIFYQDGIAPQTAIPGIEQLAPNKGGRVFIPRDWPKAQKGFIKSHHLNYFQWFHWIKPGDKGYFSRTIRN